MAHLEPRGGAASAASTCARRAGLPRGARRRPRAGSRAGRAGVRSGGGGVPRPSTSEHGAEPDAGGRRDAAQAAQYVSS
jgi:hypothetical protein